ncbi:28S ribosomal protein S18a, mitochondrial [Octopus sinensis]|uniref:28S ribosomal protein S18a, mitochondrial n=1 Tax=Octopus sinensis TaxID=2607531 RepID=A0A6P7SKH4_9MOLL|nr:28S ribosomal protein S18a, mitochondrial [Octopus sinensis]
MASLITLRLFGAPLRKNLSICRTVPVIASFSSSKQLQLKQILHKTEGNVTTIEGVHIPSPRENNVIPEKYFSKPTACPLCRLNLKVKYTDVLIVSQFVDANGKLLPQHVTKLCNRQHKHMNMLVNFATRAGLLRSLAPTGPDGKSNYIPPYKYLKYNVHYVKAPKRH